MRQKSMFEEHKRSLANQAAAKLLLIALLAATTGQAWGASRGSACEKGGRPAAGISESVRSALDPICATTPSFSKADRMQVEKALREARELLDRNREEVEELLGNLLEGEATPSELAYFLETYSQVLSNLASDQGIYDGRRSTFELAGGQGPVHHYFATGHRYLNAIALEVQLGRFVIFLGPDFFRNTLRVQAQVLLHEVLHLLGSDFTDDAFTPVLKRFRWYEPALLSSQNLQEFFERICR